jgi:ADP-ribosylglycohydrolase/protein-tyrosine phosphatase
MTSVLAHLSADRAAGVLLGCAVGDALGAGYEFRPAGAIPESIDMIGGGLGDFAPGEWTDDTAMAVAVAEVAATGQDLRSSEGLDAVAAGFARWYADGPKDIGISTSGVLSAAGAGSGSTTAARLADAAQQRYSSGHSSAGNGALMRTAAVALAHLDDAQAAADAARAVSDLTHADPTSAEACLIWTLGIRHAVLEGTLEGVRAALDFLPADRAASWAELLEEAESHEPASFENNGWVVHALQAAWSAISRTAAPTLDPAHGTFPAQHLALAIEASVRAGNDTDTVAAIAGSLLGARWGVSAVPLSWRRRVHGWPGYRARDLVRMGLHAARLASGLSADDASGWPSTPIAPYDAYPGRDAVAVHPHDDRVLLGGVDAVRDLPRGVDAVVSLCRLGADEVPASGIDSRHHVEVWLVDSNSTEDNPHLSYVLDQAARAVAELRAEDRTVLLHCVQAQSRTPSVAARYSVLARGLEPQRALDEVCAALPEAHPQPALREAVLALGTAP